MLNTVAYSIAKSFWWLISVWIKMAQHLWKTSGKKLKIYYIILLPSKFILNQLRGLREDRKVYKADDANGSLRHITISHNILGLSIVKTGERLLYAICIKVSKRKKMGYLKWGCVEALYLSWISPLYFLDYGKLHYETFRDNVC